jgi:hypothetical protein
VERQHSSSEVPVMKSFGTRARESGGELESDGERCGGGWRWCSPFIGGRGSIEEG